MQIICFLLEFSHNFKASFIAMASASNMVASWGNIPIFCVLPDPSVMAKPTCFVVFDPSVKRKSQPQFLYSLNISLNKDLKTIGDVLFLLKFWRFFKKLLDSNSHGG